MSASREEDDERNKDRSSNEWRVMCSACRDGQFQLSRRPCTSRAWKTPLQESSGHLQVELHGEGKEPQTVQAVAESRPRCARRCLTQCTQNQTLMCERDSLTQSVTDLMLWCEQGKGKPLGICGGRRGRDVRQGVQGVEGRP